MESRSHWSHSQGELRRWVQRESSFPLLMEISQFPPMQTLNSTQIRARFSCSANEFCCEICRWQNYLLRPWDHSQPYIRCVSVPPAASSSLPQMDLVLQDLRSAMRTEFFGNMIGFKPGKVEPSKTSLAENNPTYPMEIQPINSLSKLVDFSLNGYCLTRPLDLQ